ASTWRGGSHGDTACVVPGAVLGGVSRPAAQPADVGVSDLRGHPDPDPADERVGRYVVPDLRLARDELRDRGLGRDAVPRPAADDPVPAEVPTVVVLLEPRAAAGHQPGPGLRLSHGPPV